MRKKRIFKAIMALVMVFVTLISTIPYFTFAQSNTANHSTKTPTDYVYIDGERVPLDDERIQNVTIQSLPKN